MLTEGLWGIDRILEEGLEGWEGWIRDTREDILQYMAWLSSNYRCLVVSWCLCRARC